MSKEKTFRKVIVANSLAWWVIRKTIGKIAKSYRRLKVLRDSEMEAAERLALLKKVFSECRVMNGPFKAMVYPRFESLGSELGPKLLGSYERELNHIVEYVSKQKYDAIVDIGCAEGYYAVGLGMLVNKAKLYAYDTDNKALALCEEMGRLNGVDLLRGGFCDEAVIRSLDLGERSLIVSDCEGYEKELFSKSLAEYLSAHDLLIECHDFLELGITQHVLNALEGSHDVEIVSSVDDIEKTYTYDYPELDGLSLSDRYMVVRECRPVIMKWLFARSRGH